MERRLKNLPTSILQVTVPQMFSVSAVATADVCLLKTVFQSSSCENALQQGPHAVLGNIAHELVEMTIRGVGKTEEATFESLERALGTLLNDERKRLSRNPATAPYSDLPRIMSPLAWARKRRTILDMAYESAVRTRAYKVASNSRNRVPFRFENLLRDGQWIEVPIAVSELRLKGRMDVLNRRGNEVKITDVKSGRVEDENGEIITRVLRQIQLYGLMAKGLEPSAQVILTILAGSERAVPFDEDAQDETLAWLRSRMEPLVPGATVSCDSLAQVGPDCRWCDMRHRCERYLQDAPSLWVRDLEWPLPLDIWGTIERIDSNSDDLVDLTVRDAGGRRIKAFCLSDARMAGIRTGNRIWLFNLLASVTEIRGAFWRHPLNFYEIGDSASDRAWSLQAFSTTV